MLFRSVNDACVEEALRGLCHAAGTVHADPSDLLLVFLSEVAAVLAKTASELPQLGIGNRSVAIYEARKRRSPKCRGVAMCRSPCRGSGIPLPTHMDHQDLVVSDQGLL